jgi:hypothetical protein
MRLPMVDGSIESDEFIENNPDAPVPGAVEFGDRSGRIKGMGIFQIVIGSFFALFTLLFVLKNVFLYSSTASAIPIPLGTRIGVAFSWLMLSVSFLWIGIGTVRLRRWVPKVILAINWPILIMFGLTIMTAIWYAPIIMRAYIASAPAGQAALYGKSADVMTIVAVILSIVYVLIPLLHVLLFRGREVQMTCDRHNPSPCWTDALPTSVVCLFLSLSALSFGSVGQGLSGTSIRLGLVLTGVPAHLSGVLAAVAGAFIARYVVSRSLAAWWSAVIFLAIMFGGSVSTFFLMDLGEFYRMSGFVPEERIVAIEPLLSPLTQAIRVLIGINAAAIMVFMALVKKHFKPSTT